MKVIGLVTIIAASAGTYLMMKPKDVVNYGFSIVRKIPHDRDAFTQGLVYHDGFFYESTGGYGTSSIRKVHALTGVVYQAWDLDAKLFGEGLALVNDKLVQLTWRSRRGFIYSIDDFKLEREFAVNSEGWGLATNGQDLYLSDGSEFIYVLDPETFTNRKTLTVKDSVGVVKNLNELEFIDGKLWANVWRKNEIVVINSSTGRVEGRVNLDGLRSREDSYGGEDVLNGIAFDASENRLYVTGKKWSFIYEIKLNKVDS